MDSKKETNPKKIRINGEKIREIRKKKGYDQIDLANAARVSDAYISQIERGIRKNPNIYVVYAIADKLEVDLDDIVIREQEDNYESKFEIEKVEQSKDKQDIAAELENQVKLIESLEFNSPEEALKFILQQPVFMAYEGYDLEKLSEEEKIELANDMLLAMRLSIEKMKRK